MSKHQSTHNIFIIHYKIHLNCCMLTHIFISLPPNQVRYPASKIRGSDITSEAIFVSYVFSHQAFCMRPQPDIYIQVRFQIFHFLRLGVHIIQLPLVNSYESVSRVEKLGSNFSLPENKLRKQRSWPRGCSLIPSCIVSNLCTTRNGRSLLL